MALGNPIVLDPEEVRRRVGAFGGSLDVRRAFDIPDGQEYVVGPQPPEVDAEVAAAHAPDYPLATAADELASMIGHGPGGRGYLAAFGPPAAEAASAPVPTPALAPPPMLATPQPTADTAGLMPLGQGVRLPPVGAGTVLRADQDFTTPPPSPTPNSVAAKTETAPSSTGAIRAVRMPDGKIVFTNRPEYTTSGGGNEIPTREAADEIRNTDRPLTPTQLSMIDAIRSSNRSDLDKASAVRGIEHPGAGGAASDMGDVPFDKATDAAQDTRTRSALQRLEMLTALAHGRTDLNVASRSPEEQRNLGIKEIGIMDYMQSSAKPKLDAINRMADEAIAQLQSVTRDPAEREMLRRRIETQRNRDIQSVMDILAIGSGIRPQPQY